jgi:hypothetical protein
MMSYMNGMGLSLNGGGGMQASAAPQAQFAAGNVNFAATGPSGSANGVKIGLVVLLGALVVLYISTRGIQGAR